MMHSFTACSVIAGLAMVLDGRAGAQSAMLVVSHDDPDGIVHPGEVVRVSATLSWSGAHLFWNARGSVVASPDVGLASAPVFGHANPSISPNQQTILNPGVAALGSVGGVEIQSGFTPLFGPPYPAPWASNLGLVLVKFEWTAPSAVGPVQFAWEGASAQPDPLFFITSGPAVGAVPTTYIGTSLTVVPAPPAGLVLVTALAAAARRRPRPAIGP